MRQFLCASVVYSLLIVVINFPSLTYIVGVFHAVIPGVPAMTDLNWDDVRQCLEKAYFSERTHSALLLNRENGLNSSTTSLLNKSSAESVKTRRSLAGIITSIAQAYPDNGDARRSSVLADYAEESLALYVLAQAKGLDYPLGAAQRASRIRPDAEAKLGQDMQLLLNEMVSAPVLKPSSS
jgi:hypothetical protein